MGGNGGSSKPFGDLIDGLLSKAEEMVPGAGAVFGGLDEDMQLPLKGIYEASKTQMHFLYAASFILYSLLDRQEEPGIRLARSVIVGELIRMITDVASEPASLYMWKRRHDITRDNFDAVAEEAKKAAAEEKGEKDED